jgi:hypothetical protein
MSVFQANYPEVYAEVHNCVRELLIESRLEEAARLLLGTCALYQDIIDPLIELELVVALSQWKRHKIDWIEGGITYKDYNIGLNDVCLNLLKLLSRL